MQVRMNHPVFVLPEVMKAMMALNTATEKTGLPLRTTKLVHLRASQINGCSLCVDMHAKELQKEKVPDEHIFAVSAWRETPYFSAAERAALELTEALTRLSDKDDAVPDALWNEVVRHHDEKALSALLVQIAIINSWNRLNVAIKQVVGAWQQAA